MHHPFVSIIVPVYNGEKTIAECIESLLAQDYPKDRYESIIVDNNSSDRTAEIIKKYSVKYLLEDKIQSSYAARNRGIKEAKGELLAFTDADCVATEGWLREATHGFTDDQVGCVAGEIKGFAPSNHVEEYLVERNCLSQKHTLNHSFLPYPQTANAFYRKDVFMRVGLFEEGWISGGDADLAWRMQMETAYKLKYIPEALIFHRHRSNLKSLFRQRKTWGYGNVLLYKKYRKNMGKRRLKELYWEYAHIFRLFDIFLKEVFLKLRKESQDDVEYKKALLDLVASLGFKMGRLKGSLLEGCLYL